MSGGINHIMLSGCPLPPSVNGQYASLMIKGKIRRIPSKEYTRYKIEFKQWVNKNIVQIREAKETIQSWNSPLEISMIVAVKRSRLVTKDGRMKQWDVSNRCKAAHDLLADALGIDDKLFVSTPMEKVTTGGDEQVIYHISPQPLRRYEDIVTIVAED